ncbi:serine/threonine protein phosphatase 8, putative [Plasmodium chabaudi chabaudi]|uniref:Serine/threonine-protein phosphatase n=1 Tax=Plasmodium chabaudi chabaudi TaxID=31271 RepID=A0A4V0K4K9_PLACU|nr:serine/threonine protein phosphatase 8, putative [Plasmodium chabaudi chabaudi]VTZ67362.1 serine/threonine protein phosphatase 8, putative [Plasmodium chabaudi chabaudi]|eukprot:XP_016655140.1 serine/threonine protein phosphatase, putative [Plasmodium chabaudi chabaudi]
MKNGIERKENNIYGSGYAQYQNKLDNDLALKNREGIKKNGIAENSMYSYNTVELGGLGPYGMSSINNNNNYYGDSKMRNVKYNNLGMPYNMIDKNYTMNNISMNKRFVKVDDEINKNNVYPHYYRSRSSGTHIKNYYPNVNIKNNNGISLFEQGINDKNSVYLLNDHNKNNNTIYEQSPIINTGKNIYNNSFNMNMNKEIYTNPKTNITSSINRGNIMGNYNLPNVVEYKNDMFYPYEDKINNGYTNYQNNINNLIVNPDKNMNLRNTRLYKTSEYHYNNPNKNDNSIGINNICKIYNTDNKKDSKHIQYENNSGEYDFVANNKNVNGYKIYNNDSYETQINSMNKQYAPVLNTDCLGDNNDSKILANNINSPIVYTETSGNLYKHIYNNKEENTHDLCNAKTIEVPNGEAHHDNTELSSEIFSYNNINNFVKGDTSLEYVNSYNNRKGVDKSEIEKDSGKNENNNISMSNETIKINQKNRNEFLEWKSHNRLLKNIIASYNENTNIKKHGLFNLLFDMYGYNKHIFKNYLSNNDENEIKNVMKDIIYELFEKKNNKIIEKFIFLKYLFNEYGHTDYPNLISLKNFKQIFRNYKNIFSSKKIILFIFNCLDRGRKYYITESDFIIGMLACSPQMGNDIFDDAGKLRHQLIFRAYDLDRDGYLNSKEMLVFLYHIYELSNDLKHLELKTDKNKLKNFVINERDKLMKNNEKISYDYFYKLIANKQIEGTANLLRSNCDVASVVKKYFLYTYAKNLIPEKYVDGDDFFFIYSKNKKNNEISKETNNIIDSNLRNVSGYSHDTIHFSTSSNNILDEDYNNFHMLRRMNAYEGSGIFTDITENASSEQIDIDTFSKVGTGKVLANLKEKETSMEKLPIETYSNTNKVKKNEFLASISQNFEKSKMNDIHFDGKGRNTFTDSQSVEFQTNSYETDYNNIYGDEKDKNEIIKNKANIKNSKLGSMEHVVEESVGDMNELDTMGSDLKKESNNFEKTNEETKINDDSYANEKFGVNDKNEINDSEGMNLNPNRLTISGFDKKCDTILENGNENNIKHDENLKEDQDGENQIRNTDVVVEGSNNINKDDNILLESNEKTKNRDVLPRFGKEENCESNLKVKEIYDYDLIVDDNEQVENSIKDVVKEYREKYITDHKLLTLNQDIAFKVFTTFYNICYKKKREDYKNYFDIFRVCNYNDVLLLCDEVVKLFKLENSLELVNLPCKIFGDIHGNLFDVVDFFNMYNWPMHDNNNKIISSLKTEKELENDENAKCATNQNDMKYVFLGNYLNRGELSLEVICFLFSLKILFPRHIYLIRGNHENRLFNYIYGFYKDIEKKIKSNFNCLGKINYKDDVICAYSYEVFNRINDVLEFLPLSVLLDNEILCIHSGIGDSIQNVKDYLNIEKPVIIPENVDRNNNNKSEILKKIIIDTLWSDPINYLDDNDMELLKSCKKYDIIPSSRGKITVKFGKNRLSTFLKSNKIKMIIRGNECIPEGYKYDFNKKILTLFSATNYCNKYKNNASSALIIKKNKNITIFNQILKPECENMNLNESRNKEKANMVSKNGEEDKINKSENVQNETKSAHNFDNTKHEDIPSKTSGNEYKEVENNNDLIDLKAPQFYTNKDSTSICNDDNAENVLADDTNVCEKKNDNLDDSEIMNEMLKVLSYEKNLDNCSDGKGEEDENDKKQDDLLGSDTGKNDGNLFENPCSEHIGSEEKEEKEENMGYDENGDEYKGKDDSSEKNESEENHDHDKFYNNKENEIFNDFENYCNGKSMDDINKDLTKFDNFGMEKNEHNNIFFDEKKYEMMKDEILEGCDYKIESDKYADKIIEENFDEKNNELCKSRNSTNSRNSRNNTNSIINTFFKNEKTIEQSSSNIFLNYDEVNNLKENEDNFKNGNGSKISSLSNENIGKCYNIKGLNSMDEIDDGLVYKRINYMMPPDLALTNKTQMKNGSYNREHNLATMRNTRNESNTMDSLNKVEMQHLPPDPQPQTKLSLQKSLDDLHDSQS